MISCIYEHLKIEVAKQGEVSGEQLEGWVAINWKLSGDTG